MTHLLVLQGLVLFLVLAMVFTTLPWIEAVAITFWIIAVRPKYAVPLLVITLVLLGVSGLGVFALTHGRLIWSAIVLTVWATPFAAIPALNGLAKWRDRGATAPVPLGGTTATLWTYIFDVRRSRQIADYQPPPVL